jgi:hypothetical protein
MNTLCRIGGLIVAAAISLPAAGAPPHVPVFDEYGLEKNPICSYALTVALEVMQKQFAGGEKAQSADWKMEIYVNPQRSSWTVVGTRLTPDWDEDEMCPLARGLGDYTTQKWYQAFFKQPR